MDPYFDPKKSSSATVKTCNSNQRCVFKQSYSEGSSWQAYKVKDTVWIGGEQQAHIPSSKRYAISFEFGCQSSETGLFRTQHVDGIMGFSSMIDTLPHQLANQRITSTKLFAMCFRVGGGALTLGGYDARLHHPNTVIKYANLLKSSGWFTVRLLDVLLKDPTTGTLKSIGENPAKYNGGKGAIVDSGTTDTYLPSAVRGAFQSVFNSLSSGVKYSNNKILLSDRKLNSLPTIVYRIAGKTGEHVDVECPPTSYAEALKPDRNQPKEEGEKPYAFRIYLTEGSGTVLGANFMNDHNVIFDIENGRVGFAESDCKSSTEALSTSPPGGYVELPVSPEVPEPEEVGTAETFTESTEAALPALSNMSSLACYPQVVTPCDARCQLNYSDTFGSSPYVAYGVQWWNSNPCSKASFLGFFSGKVSERCAVRCGVSGITDGTDPLRCLNTTWSLCSSNCMQSRTVFQSVTSSTLCGEGEIETRSCAVFECPIKNTDYVVSIDLKVGPSSAAQYSAYQSEDLFSALARLLGVCTVMLAILV
jgi:hypothetical protein